MREHCEAGTPVRPRHPDQPGLLGGRAALRGRRVRAGRGAAGRRRSHRVLRRCGRRGTTPRPTARWASASSPTSPWRPATRSARSGPSACWCSTGTCTTATAPTRSSTPRPRCCSRASTSGRSIPGTGALADAGSGAGEGFTINLPVPAGAGRGRVARPACSTSWRPPRATSGPDLILISAGFDAHRDDPLADCRLETSSFAQLAAEVGRWRTSWACPVGAVLEGGYDTGRARRLGRGDDGGPGHGRGGAAGGARPARAGGGRAGRRATGRASAPDELGEGALVLGAQPRGGAVGARARSCSCRANTTKKPFGRVLKSSARITPILASLASATAWRTWSALARSSVGEDHDGERPRGPWARCRDRPWERAPRRWRPALGSALRLGLRPRPWLRSRPLPRPSPRSSLASAPVSLCSLGSERRLRHLVLRLVVDRLVGEHGAGHREDADDDRRSPPGSFQLGGRL